MRDTHQAGVRCKATFPEMEVQVLTRRLDKQNLMVGLCISEKNIMYGAILFSRRYPNTLTKSAVRMEFRLSHFYRAAGGI